MSNPLQLTVLQKIVHDEKYCRKVLPFIKTEYFDEHHKVIYRLILDFISKYNKLPTKTALEVDFQNAKEVTEENYTPLTTILESLKDNPPVEENWLLASTEKWCKDRAIDIALIDSIQIRSGEKKDITREAIPDILQKAIALTFDTSVGHDYIGDFAKRYDFYHRVEDRLPFDLEKFNLISKGGVPRKTLNIILAGTGVGKSMFMCHQAASALSLGKNVLYITLEMAEERIAERIDANLLNVAIDQLPNLPKDLFAEKVQRIASTTVGKLIIKEYPTASAHANHFRALLNELKLKKEFIPDVIFIDYLNICASARMKGLGGSVNTYSLIKAIAEELRGLAVEFNVPIFSATQTTRSGYSNTDVDLTDTSESFGLPATADFMFALISTEELERLNQIMVKQLKNRYNDPTANKRFLIGVDRSKMRLFDVEEKAQTLTKEPTVKGGNSWQKESSGDNMDFTNFKV